MDTRKVELAAYIWHEGNLVPCRKLNPDQTQYTTIQRKLRSIVETTKEFRNIYREDISKSKLIMQISRENFLSLTEF
jgi:hypothetical protein